jgi:hypothetical protein
MADYSSFKRIASDSIIDGSILAGDISSNAILETNIASNAVTAAKIANNAVGNSQLASTIDLSSKTINYRQFVNDDISNSAGIVTSKLTGLGTLATLNSVGSSQISSGAATSAKLATGAQQAGYVFYGHLSNDAAIEGGSTVWSQFSAYSGGNGNSDVFETISSGEGGVLIKKAGQIVWYYTQDIRTSGSSGYFHIDSYIDSTMYGRQLMRNSNSEWDCIFISGAYQNAANDVLKIRYSAAPLALDSNPWSQLAVLWIGYL